MANSERKRRSFERGALVVRTTMRYPWIFLLLYVPLAVGAFASGYPVIGAAFVCLGISGTLTVGSRRFRARAERDLARKRERLQGPGVDPGA